METETTAHFLLHCNIFTAERNKMFQEIIRPIIESKRLRMSNDDLYVKFLLYGHERLNNNENRTVLNALLKYIHESKRFET